MAASLAVLAWLKVHGAVIFAVLYGICEALAHIPQIEANSVFQLIENGLKALGKILGMSSNQPPAA